MSDSNAELYEHNLAGSNITVVVAGVFYKWVTSMISIQGIADLVTASAVTDDFTIQANGGGLYIAAISIDFGGPNAALVQWSVHVNGVMQIPAQAHLVMKGAAIQEIGPINAQLQLVPGDVIDLRVTSNGAGDVIRVYHVTFDLMSRVRDK